MFRTAIAAVFLASAPAFAAPPNIVMILGDDQGWNDYGFMEIGRAHV